MKKFCVMFISALLCLGVLSGCGIDYETKESTVFILDDGSVVSTDVEKIDTKKIKEKDLEEYINKQIDEYNEANDGDVELNDFSVEDGVATLIVEYDSAEEYSDFNGIELFNGTIAEALAKGYKFEEEFASISNGKAKSAKTSEFTEEDGYKVIVYAGDANVYVEDGVSFASVKNTKIVDENTIAIKAGKNLLEKAIDDTEASSEEGTDVVQENVDGTEAGEENGDSSSVSEDDLLNAVEEESEVSFDFGDEEEEIKTDYTYVIYK